MRHLNKKYWPHRVEVKNSNSDDVYEWCCRHLPGKHRWTFIESNVWYFTKEKDVTMFLLRWQS